MLECPIQNLYQLPGIRDSLVLQVNGCLIAVSEQKADSLHLLVDIFLCLESCKTNFQFVTVALVF
jgi:hypothetical protein